MLANTRAPTRCSATARRRCIIADGGSGPTERQWLVRLENGEQKTCRERATVQQGSVAGVATRESLISRSGKTWKRLGDIAELSQYFSIADEARTQRAHKPTPKPVAGTMLGVGGPTAAADGRCPTTRRRTRRRARPSAPIDGRRRHHRRAKARGRTRAPKSTELAPKLALRRPRSRWVARAAGRDAGAVPAAGRSRRRNVGERPRSSPASRSRRCRRARAAARFSIGGVEDNELGDVRRGRVPDGSRRRTDRSTPARSARPWLDDDDDGMIAPQRGSRAGTWIAIAALVVIAGGRRCVSTCSASAQARGWRARRSSRRTRAAVAVAADAGGAARRRIIAADAAAAVAVDPLDSVRVLELARRRRAAHRRACTIRSPTRTISGVARDARTARRPGSRRSDARIAQRLEADKAEADKLRKDGKQLRDRRRATLAQKALKAKAADDAEREPRDGRRDAACRCKPAHDVDQGLAGGEGQGGADDKELARSIAVADAQTRTRARRQVLRRRASEGARAVVRRSR